MGTIIDLFKDKRDVFANLRQDASGYGWNLIPRDLGKELFEEIRGGDNHDYVTVLVFSDDKVQLIDYIPVGTDKPTMKSAETMVDLKDYVVDNAPEEELYEVIDFCRAVGLPVSLEELGVTEDKKEKAWIVAQAACGEGEVGFNMPMEITPERYYNAILAADAIGRDA